MDMNRMDDEALHAQSDEESLSKFIEKNEHFILGCAFRVTHRFVSKSDDSWSVAMIAFAEAVRTFDRSKGAFRSFAALVIRRRLLDMQDAERHFEKEIPVEPFAMEGDPDSEEVNGLQMEVMKKTAQISLESSEDTSGNDVRAEIEAVQKMLGRYGFTFLDLTECSPKADKTKRACAKAVATILRDDRLFQSMRTTGTLPMKELCEISGVSRKILDRYRRYIIAAAEIMNGEYPQLKDYMDYIRKELGYR
jgi:RNA polymerase sigma factor